MTIPSKKLLTLIITVLLLPACKAGDASLAIHPESGSSVKNSQNHQSSPYTTHYLMGKFNPAKTALFVKIPKKYTDRTGLYIREEALNAFIKMQAAAKKSGVKLTIRSATRNFSYQKRIWERKWLGKRKLSDGTNVARDIRNPVDKSLKILQYSAMPGTSRHHWGTDIDLNSFSNKWFESGKGLKLFNWLEVNAEKYGFCRPYTANRPHGYQEEKWHWSYLPLSVPMTKVAQQTLNDQQISGFLGSETAQQIGVVNKYILGISKSCR
ncbi:MAG: M15 family metallopeptidase [Thiotrichaceae bacterium]